MGTTLKRHPFSALSPPRSARCARRVWNPPGGRLALFSSALRPPATSFGSGASSGPRSSRCLTPRGWTLLFAGVRFGRSASRAPSILRSGRVPTGSRARWRARRRLSTPWMRTLRAPSFHAGAGRAFTRCVPSSDTSMSSRGTGASAPSPTASGGPARRSWACEVQSTARPGSSHRPLAEGPPAQRWPAREDGGTTRGACRRIGVPACLRRSARRFHPRAPGAFRHRTKSRRMPSL